MRFVGDTSPLTLDSASRRGEHGCMSEDKKEFFNLVCYVKGKKKKVGYAYLTKGGNLAIRSDKRLDPCPEATQAFAVMMTLMRRKTRRGYIPITGRSA